MTSEAEQTWRAIYRAYTRLAPTIDKQLKSAVGMTYSEYEALSQLKAAAGALTMADLASYVAVTRTHASRLVDALEHAGLAKREPNPDDKRSIFVAITREGVRRLQTSAPAVESILATSIGSVLSGEEIHLLSSQADRVATHEA
ncbi:MarR family winged helix-turn-helix transcriptional regulator [Microcella sp.]|uniref:MarR family winged helix-turn-helix transcriptional regulator n=1 Tax=Microcella sp. TaxID=1913979 RepID=UPI00391B6479